MIYSVSANPSAPKLAELARKLKKDLPEEPLEISLDSDDMTPISALRQQYQRGLAAWLRKDQAQEALCLMQQAVENVLCSLPLNNSRQLWWLVCGFLDVLIYDEYIEVEAAPRLLAAVERQLKLLMSKESDFNDDLAVQLLFVLDKARNVSMRLSRIKQHYQLDEPIFDIFEPELVPIFIQESLELYPKIRSTLFSAVNDSLSQESLHHVLRWLHTLKGSARMAGAMLAGHLLHQMESELLSYLEQKSQSIWDDLLHELNEFSLLLNELQQNFPIQANELKIPETLQDLYSRLQLLAEQTATQLDKTVDFQLTGGDLALPKKYITHLISPLEHLVRNAVVHGIESAQARKKIKKNAYGKLQLTVAYHEEGWLISLTDDGAGLQLEQIKQKALQKHIIEADELIDDEALAQLIFLPGLSTQNTISELAGRGIGLDVVASEIKQLGGCVFVHSKIGEGASFDIFLT